jgi:hypothetical protein
MSPSILGCILAGASGGATVAICLFVVAEAKERFERRKHTRPMRLK